LDAFIQHLDAEWAGNPHHVRIGIYELVCPGVVDTVSLAFFNPHVTTSGAAAEATLATAGTHLNQL
jgi:hypothetical protein